MTSAATNPPSSSVLIVDQSEATREVLRTVLQSRGVSILEARQADQGLEILRTRHPNVVVVDLEDDRSEADKVQAAFENESREQDVSLVLLGRVARSEARDSDHRMIDKPYHYGPLIRTIEQLLHRH